MLNLIVRLPPPAMHQVPTNQKSHSFLDKPCVLIMSTKNELGCHVKKKSFFEQMSITVGQRLNLRKVVLCSQRLVRSGTLSSVLATHIRLSKKSQLIVLQNRTVFIQFVNHQAHRCLEILKQAASFGATPALHMCPNVFMCLAGVIFRRKIILYTAQVFLLG